MNTETIWNGMEALAELDLAIRPLVQLEQAPENEILRRLAAQNAAVLVSQAQWVAPCRNAGIADVFLDCTAQSVEVLAAVFSTCHFVLRDHSALTRLDSVAASRLSEGYMENVTLALDLARDDADAFHPQNIPQFARWIRRSEALAVRGVFLDLAGQPDPSAAARDAFSLVKKLRSDLPCVLHRFCLSGLLSPLADGDSELAKTLKMLASLNDTSLYADFLIG